MGTGFFVSIKIDEEHSSDFLCTCKHIVKDAIETTIFLHTLKNGIVDLGNPIRIELEKFPDKFILDSDYDIAIMPFTPIYNEFYRQGIKIFFKSYDITLIPTIENVDRQIHSIEKIYLIGYPDDRYDTINMIPVIRAGLTATPFSVNFKGEPKFLIDASIFGGSSGSPVLILEMGGYLSKEGNFVFGSNKIYLLGIVSQCYEDDKEQNIDLGIVCKSELIRDTVVKFKGETISRLNPPSI
jgi:hypothetical protein